MTRHLKVTFRENNRDGSPQEDVNYKVLKSQADGSDSATKFEWSYKWQLLSCRMKTKFGIQVGSIDSRQTNDDRA